MRNVLCDALNEWIHCDPDSLAIIKQAIGELHSASLIIDDIEDRSETRRGRPCAHVTFGMPQALNSANYAYFIAMQTLSKLEPPRDGMMDIFCDEMLSLHRGQGKDIHWRETLYVASETEYRGMVVDKTGGLFRMAARLMMCVKKPLMSPSVILSVMDDLAYLFQIRDDFLNLYSPRVHRSKGYCEDITEGKLSFVVLHAFKNSSVANELLSILSSGTNDQHQIDRALQIMNEAGSFDFTLKTLSSLTKALRHRITSLGAGSFAFEMLLDQMVHEIGECKMMVMKTDDEKQQQGDSSTELFDQEEHKAEI